MLPLRDLVTTPVGVRLYWAYATAPAVAAQFSHVQLRHATLAIIVEAIYVQAITALDLVDLFVGNLALPAGVAGTLKLRDRRVVASTALVEQTTNAAKQTNLEASYGAISVPVGNAFTPILGAEGYLRDTIQGPLVFAAGDGPVLIPQTVANGFTALFAYRELS